MSQSAEEESLILPDGRTLCYTTFGVSPSLSSSSSSSHTQSRSKDQQQIPTVFYFHGLPGSQVEGRSAHQAASAKGIRIIALSRPGYGGSTYQPNRTLLSYPPDVLALADHLNIRQFAILGISGGGPFALACVHGLPRERLIGAMVVSGMYPVELGMSGMMLINRLLFNLTPWVPMRLLSLVLDFFVGRVARDNKKLAMAMAQTFESRPAEDMVAIHAEEDKVLKVMVDSTKDSFRHGALGFACEAKLFSIPWGFDLKDLKVEKEKGEGKTRLVIWHGEKDVNVPLQMAEKAAKMIPDCEFKVERNEAHISLFANKMDEIIDTLLAMF